MSRLLAVAAAKGKALGVVALSLSAGGVGGAVALAHVHAADGPQTVRVVADSSAEPTSSPDPTESPEPSESPDPSESPEASPSPDASTPSPTAYSLPPCPASGNHGSYVSSVAHSAPKGPEHGTWVSKDAQSDCGKRHSAEPTTSPTPEKTGSGHASGKQHGHSGSAGSKGGGSKHG